MWIDIDEFTDHPEEEEQCSVTQMSIIEGLLIVAEITQKEKEQISMNIERFSDREAYETINYLKENSISNDPAQQWAKRIKIQ